jgi:hypothetical protein
LFPLRLLNSALFRSFSTIYFRSCLYFTQSLMFSQPAC